MHSKQVHVVYAFTYTLQSDQAAQPTKRVGCSVAVELVDRGNNCYRPVTNARQPAFASYAIGIFPPFPTHLPFRLSASSHRERRLWRSLYFLIKITLMLLRVFGDSRDPDPATFLGRSFSRSYLSHPCYRSAIVCSVFAQRRFEPCDSWLGACVLTYGARKNLVS